MKTNEKGNRGNCLIMWMSCAFRAFFLRIRVKGITPFLPFPTSPHYNPSTPIAPHQGPSVPPHSTPRRSILSYMLSIVFPSIYNIPPNRPTIDTPHLKGPSPYIQSYTKPTTPHHTTPTIHHPFAYSLNVLILVFSLIHIRPPNRPRIDYTISNHTQHPYKSHLASYSPLISCQTT